MLSIAERYLNKLNRARRPAMHFYQDSNRNEVDLIVDIGATRIAMEVKSAMTFTPEWITALDRIPSAVILAESRKMLVYMGQSEMPTS